MTTHDLVFQHYAESLVQILTAEEGDVEAYEAALRAHCAAGEAIQKARQRAVLEGKEKAA